MPSKIVSPTSRAISRTTPATSPTTTCSILRASMTATGWPGSTVSPSATAKLITAPCIGAATATVPSGPGGTSARGPASAGSSAPGPAPACRSSSASGSIGSTRAPGPALLRAGRLEVAGPVLGGVPAGRRRAPRRSRVCSSPAARAGLFSRACRKAMLVRDPVDLELAQRPAGPGGDGGQVVGRDDHLGQQRVVARPRSRSPRSRSRRPARPAPTAGRRPRARRRPAGPSRRRSSTPGSPAPAGPRPAGRARCPASARARPASAPSAIFSWTATRSRPITVSVTVCSTCSRALASMKAKRGAAPGRASTRNSMVPTPR